MRGIILLGVVLLSTINLKAQSNLELASIFTDNMVLQRDQPIRIWGWSDANNSVTVSMGGNEKKVIAAANGKWLAELPSKKAGGPYEISISTDSDTKTLSNVYMGDVWICSGQSNMEWTVVMSGKPKYEIANSNHPMIRHIKIERSWNRTPQERVISGEWEVANPQTTGDFTAVGYYFARELRKHVDVPIGLINSTWGGSRIEPWMREEVVSPYYTQDVSSYLDSLERENEKAVREMMDLIGDLIEKDELVAAKKSGYDDSGWITQNLPGLWENQGYPMLDGIVWLRKEIFLSESEAEAGMMLSLGKIDDSDSTYVNGNLVGSMRDSYNIDRKYMVSPEFLKTGSNTIMIQVEDVIYGGGLYGEADALYYKTSSGEESLAGIWKMKVEHANDGIAPQFQTNQQPTLLYNSMIAPITDFPVKGALWYQGESNAGQDDSYVYREQFKDMITDWRKVWNQGDFPFFWVQLTNFGQSNELPVDDGWGMLRESQTDALSLPNTAQAVIIDIGEADDIHPKNKQDVGYRLSLAARKVVYGEDELVYSGPVYESMQIEDNRIVLSFNHIGSGLIIGRGFEELKEFAISDDGVNYVHAKAIIKGDKVVVWSDKLDNPKHVRYAWKMNPEKANLYNREGLPASPFRTDK